MFEKINKTKKVTHSSVEILALGKRSNRRKYGQV